VLPPLFVTGKRKRPRAISASRNSVKRGGGGKEKREESGQRKRENSKKKNVVIKETHRLPSRVHLAVSGRKKEKTKWGEKHGCLNIDVLRNAKGGEGERKKKGKSLHCIS